MVTKRCHNWILVGGKFKEKSILVESRDQNCVSRARRLRYDVVWLLFLAITGNQASSDNLGNAPPFCGENI